jgi:hypothetical protein
MAERGEVVFRQKRCRACNAVFVICRSCDRGQRYCNPGCRVAALREQRRRANRRHQHSPEGRLDHRDRQREYRKRCARRRVTDTSSVALTSPGNISTWPRESEKTVVPLSFRGSLLGCRVAFSWREREAEHPRRQSAVLRCVICGRSGRFIDPFPPSWGRRS